MPTYLRYKRVAKKNSKALVIPRDEWQGAWEQRLLEAEAHKAAWKKEFRVEDLERAYYGHQRPEDWPEDSWFTINLLFASAKIMKRNVCPRQLKLRLELARTFSAEPELILQMQQITSLREAVLQYFLKQMKLWYTGQLCYINSLFQFGVAKVGYSAEMEDNPNAGAPAQDKMGGLITDENGIPIVEPAERVKEEEFLIDEIDPDCFLVDRYCQNSISKTGRWVAQKFFKPVEEVQASDLYSPSRTKDLGPSALFEAEKAYLKRSEEYKTPYDWDTGVSLPENELIVGYEIYDLMSKQVLTVARGAKKLLRDPGPLPPGVAMHPFCTLKMNERRSAWYPIPAIFNLLGAQFEYNLTRNQTAQHRKRFNRRYLYNENKIDAEEVDKVLTGGDGVAARCSAEGALEPVKDAPLDSAVYSDTSVLKEEFMELSGVGQLQRAVVGAESATEAEIVERRAREGEIDEHEEMMEFLSAIMRKLHDSVEANLTQEGAVNTVGPRGANWVSFGPEHFKKITGQVLFSVEAEEISRMTLQVERAQLLQLIDILGKNMLLALDPVLLRAVTSKFPALANNEPLIASLQKIALVSLQVQAMQSQQKAGASKAGGGDSTKKVAQNSRKVATGK